MVVVVVAGEGVVVQRHGGLQRGVCVCVWGGAGALQCCAPTSTPTKALPPRV